MAIPAGLCIRMQGGYCMTPALLRAGLAQLGRGYGNRGELQDRIGFLNWAEMTRHVPLEHTWPPAQVVAAYQNGPGGDWTAD